MLKLARHWPILFIALVALIPTWQFVVGNKVPAPVDQVHSLPPWNGPPPTTEYDALTLDGALQFLPWRHFMLDSMRHGNVPLWNPYTFGGSPFLANSQSAPLYPLHWLWPFGAESLLGFSAWLHLAIAGLGVFLLCKRLGSDDKGGAIAGSAIALSAFMVGWLQLPSVQMTAAWIPWCLLGVFRLVDEPNAKSIAKLALSIALMLLAGHLQIAAFGLLAVVVSTVWLAVFERRTMSLFLVACSLLLALFVASPQLLATLEAGRSGHRAAPASETGWQAYQAQAITPSMLVTVFDPAHFGNPQWGEGLTGYWLTLKEPGRNYAESAWFVGPAIFPLALLALFRMRRNPRTMLLAALCVLSLLIAFGTIVAKLAYFYLPGWSATGSPGRASILFAIPLCVLGGLALSKHDEDKLPKWLAPAAVLTAVAGIAWAFLSYDPTPVTKFYGPPPQSAGLAAALTLPALVAVLLIGLGGKKWRGLAAGLALAVQLVFLSLMHHDINPGSEKGRYNEPFAEMEHLQGKTVAVVNENWSLFGPAAGASAPPNTLLPYGITELGGYDSIISRKTKETLDDVNGRDSAPAANGNMLFVKPKFDVKKLMALGADLVVAAYQLDLPIVHDMGSWRIYSLPGAKPPTPVLDSSYNDKRLRWDLAGQNWLKANQPAGWRLAAPASDTAKVTYEPESYRLGFLLSMFGISTVVALSWLKSHESASSTNRP